MTRIQKDSEEEIRFKGAPLSEGIAIGVPFFIAAGVEDVIPEFPIALSEVDDEIARYRRALFSSREDLQELLTHLVSEGSTDAITIIDTHIQMLEDPLITTHMEEKIRQMRQNTESVFRSVIKEYEVRFAETKDLFFQQRRLDVADLSRRILGHLCAHEKLSFTDIPPNSIVFAKQLVPSDTAAVQASRVSALVTQSDGNQTHTALIARDKGIPYVSSINLQLLENIKGKCVIVDGLTGDIIINPSQLTLEKYQELKQRLKIHYKQLEQEIPLKAETADGHPIGLFANVGSLADMEACEHYRAAGVGLFRSEYFFLQNETFFSSEEEQFTIYKQVLESAKGKPVVIRVFDVGGDKYPSLFPGIYQEVHPVFGCRGIRFLLRHEVIFKNQLRALMRASAYGDVRILLPLIADLNELREAKRIISEVRKGLSASIKPIPLGCMIEVPSAVWILDLLLEECDFISIGTNDLMQYTLGVDRSTSELGGNYFPLHPSVIRMLKTIVVTAKHYRKEVSICGELASNPILQPLLLGIGLRAFSCAPRYLPLVKRVVRHTALPQAVRIADQAQTLKTTQDISRFLLEEYQKLFPHG